MDVGRKLFGLFSWVFSRVRSIILSKNLCFAKFQFFKVFAEIGSKVFWLASSKLISTFPEEHFVKQIVFLKLYAFQIRPKYFQLSFLKLNINFKDKLFDWKRFYKKYKIHVFFRVWAKMFDLCSRNGRSHEKKNNMLNLVWTNSITLKLL